MREHLFQAYTRANSVSTHIWLLWGVFFIFIGAFGSEFGAPLYVFGCYIEILVFLAMFGVLQ